MNVVDAVVLLLIGVYASAGYRSGLLSGALSIGRVHRGGRGRSEGCANAHVVAGTSRVSVRLNGDDLPARVVLFDAARDVAVLAVPATPTTEVPGNSGGPLLDPHGAVLGIVFARALDSSDTGFVLTAHEVTPDACAGRTASAPRSTGSCLSD